MDPTILNNWLLRPFFYGFASVLLFVSGWKAKGGIPISDTKKYVLIAAPHSSNWDFVFFLLVVFKFRLSVHWMGKHTMFRWPFGRLLERLGGIPVDRSRKGDFVKTMARAFNRSEELILTIAPSGTRGNVRKWKTGFYHIARQAGVPILLGFIDYKKRIAGIGPSFCPSGDIEADMSAIRLFYKDFSGKYRLPS